MFYLTFIFKEDWKNEVEWTGKTENRTVELPSATKFVKLRADRFQATRDGSFDSSVFSADGNFSSGSIVPNRGALLKKKKKSYV